MSGLEGLGIASNVMAVITFALDTVKLCKSIIDNGSADPNLDENAKNTRQTSDALENMLSQQRLNPTAAEIRLRDLAAKCVQCARDVEKMVEDISPQKDGVYDAMKSTAKTLRRKGQLEKLKNQLEAWKSTMDSAVIVQILNECIASGELHRNDYDNLSQKQKTLIETYEQRSRAIEDLIRNVPSHITAEHVETRQSLTQRTDLLEARNHEKQAYEKLLQSLKYPRMNERANSIPMRHVKTLEWIFGATENDYFERDDMEVDADSDGSRSSHNSEGDPMMARADDRLVYQKWKDEAMEEAERARQEAGILEWLRHDDRHLYWISGKPGSGKSTLMKFIATDERTKTVLQDWDPKPSIISHFFWKPGSPLQQSLHGLLCSLLYQVLSEDTNVAFQLLRNNPRLQTKSEESDWDVEDSERILFQAIRFSPRAYFILLDGLDELAKPYGGMDRLFGLLDKLVAEGRVKVCVSSRPERLFMDRLGSNPMLRMQDFTRGDILQYTTDVLDSITAPHEDDFLPKIAEQICYRAEGVFIWVYVVLQNVKTGIDEFEETWRDVYDRIIELPPDLMKLYQDMWSRLGGSNKKYIKKAARYFQLVRYLKYHHFHCNIATLSVSDDETQEVFTGSDKILPIQKLIGMCENTFNTLMPVTAGILHVNKMRDDFHRRNRTAPSENDEKVIAWECMDVKFIHRSAVDFLDSDEGIDLFGKYNLDNDTVLSVRIKGELVLRSATAYRRYPLSGVWRSMDIHSSTEGGVKPVVNNLLHLIHRHAVDENRDLLELENCEGVSRQHRFMFEAAFHGFYGYVEDWLKSTGTYDGPAAAFALLGSCHYKIHQADSPNERYRFIRDLLKRPTWCSEDKLEPSVVFSASDNIMLAWRCFMVDELRRKLSCPDRLYRRLWIEEVLAYFIAAGVMAESPQPTYLVSVARQDFSVVDGHNSGPFHSSTVYAEVNDACLLHALLNVPGETSKLLSFAGTGAVMRPVLGVNGGGLHRDTTFFRLSSDESQQEALETWTFGEFANNSKDAKHAIGLIRWLNPKVESVFPDTAPDFLEVTNIGMFSSHLDALKEIGYELPEVNRGYFCPLERWV